MARDFPDLETARTAWPSVLAGLDTAVLQEQRWFQRRDAAHLQVEAADFIFPAWEQPEEIFSLNILQVQVDGESQLYFLPLLLMPARADLPAMSRLSIGGLDYILAEASLSRRAASALLAQLAAGARLDGRNGAFVFHPSAPGFVRAVRPLTGDSTNSVLRLHRDEVQKITRRLWPGPSREVDICLALKGQPFIPSIHGHLTYETASGQIYSLALWAEYLPNRGSIWDALVAGLTDTLRLAIAPGQPGDPGEVLSQWLLQIVPDLNSLALLTANLHMALAGIKAPEPFRLQDLQPILAQARENLTSAGRDLPQESAVLWQQALDLLVYLLARLENAPMLGYKIQTHGDFHLGQILLAEEGFAVLDLEGEPLLEPERRAMYTTPLRDLAGLIRSFSYVGQAAYLALLAGQRVLPEQETTARFLARRFEERARQIVIQAYGAAMNRLSPELIPGDPVLFIDLLEICKMEKVSYELLYELANRPEWVVIPLNGLKELLQARLGNGISAGPG